MFGQILVHLGMFRRVRAGLSVDMGKRKKDSL